MELKTSVWVRNITNLSDARYCAGMGVEALSFCINPKAEFYVEPELYLGLTGWVSGLDLYAETNLIDKSILEDYVGIKGLIVDSNNPGLKFLETHLDLIIDIDIDDKNGDDIEKIIDENSQANQFILSSKTDYLDLSLVESLLTEHIRIGAGVSKESLPALIGSNAIGLALSAGGQEERPGFKNYDELADILEALEVD